jgi:hypothetical protein
VGSEHSAAPIAANSRPLKTKITMTPEREKEYDELLAYVGHFATVVWKISPTAQIHPAKTIERVVRKFGKYKALMGLR